MEHPAAHALPTAIAFTELLILLLPLPLIVAANWHESPPKGSGAVPRGAALVGSATWFVLGLLAAACILFALFTLALVPSSGAARGGNRSVFIYSAVLLVTGLVAATLIAEPVREQLARILPIDPRSAVHGTALVLSASLVGSQLASQLATDVLSQQATSGPALAPIDLVVQELPFLLASVLGVGLFMRRGTAATLTRLGLVRPTAWQILLGLGAAGLFFAFGNGMDALAHLVTPGTAQKVEVANQRLFGQLGDPVGIATIALSAGICEEALFRGAMQPRLGVLWSALVFTAVHAQYGLSLVAAAVLVLAVGLGLLRRLTNTTTSTICHVVYNTLVGVGVAGVWLGPALAIEAGLLIAGLAAFLTGRVGSLRTAP